MKRLTAPVVICLLFVVAATACEELDLDLEDSIADSSPRTTELQSQVDALQQQVAELTLESQRQARLVQRQAEVIERLEARLTALPTPVFVPQPIVPQYQPGQAVPPEFQQWWDREWRRPSRPKWMPQHPSAQTPAMPRGTQQGAINGVPFYIIPLSGRDG